jgi:hypothetical protein
MVRFLRTRKNYLPGRKLHAEEGFVTAFKGLGKAEAYYSVGRALERG